MTLIAGSPPITNTLALTELEGWREEELTRQKEILLCRKYFEGEQEVAINDRLQQFLGDQSRDGPRFRLNLLKVVVNALVERLRVKTFDSLDTAFSQWAWDVWTANGLSSLQEDVYEGALVDGEYFALIDWNDDEGRPDVTVYPRWTDPYAEGDGYGMKAVYQDGDPNLPMLFAVRYWYDITEDAETGQKDRQSRRNLYFPNRVLKQRYNSRAEWTTFDTVWWTDNQDEGGTPLGIPVVHFQNRKLRSEIWDALPIQDLLNKEVVDLAATSDMTAFRIYVALGFIPTKDGKEPKEDQSNWLDIEPGRIIGTTKSKRDANFDAIEPSDLRPVIETAKELMQWMALVTDTPLSRFSSSGQLARSETLKEQDSPLIAKTISRQDRFGNAWEKVLDICQTLHNTFSSKDQISSNSALETKWKDAEIRNEADRIEMLVLKREIGVPLPFLWSEAGYTQAEIDAMKQSEEYKRLLEALGPLPSETQTNEPTQPAQ